MSAIFAVFQTCPALCRCRFIAHTADSSAPLAFPLLLHRIKHIQNNPRHNEHDPQTAQHKNKHQTRPNAATSSLCGRWRRSNCSRRRWSRRTGVGPRFTPWLYPFAWVPGIKMLANPKKKKPQQSSKKTYLVSLLNTIKRSRNTTSFQQYKRRGVETCNVKPIVILCFYHCAVLMPHRARYYRQPQHSAKPHDLASVV